MVRALDVARYFVRLASDEVEPELVTNLRLQKLLYYAQGWSLAMRGKPLFADAVEAWQHGPVVRSVYHAIKLLIDNPRAPVPESFGSELPSDALPNEDRMLIRSVWQGYKRYSANELLRKTHLEMPWRETPRDEPIDLDMMRQAFEDLHQKHGRPVISIDHVRKAEEDVRSGRILSLEEIRRQLRA